MRESQPAPSPATPSASSRSAAERGSAMIIALLIMIILTLLGVTFLVLSEQEEQISVNERDHAQALYLAEAGAELARSWFQEPSHLEVPAAGRFNRNLRRGAIFQAGYSSLLERTAPVNHTEVQAPANKYTGGNLSGAGGLFDKPYRGAYAFGLWGRRNTPDVLICSGNLDINGDTANDCINDVDTDADTVPDVNSWIRDLNDTLLVDPIDDDGHVPRDFGLLEIEQIRIYRPPLDFDLRTRYGIATIEAAAVKRVKGRVVTRRFVREVLQEIPFPGPSGAIEAEGRIGEGGSAGVHWGPVISSAETGNIELPNSSSANFPDGATPRSSSTRWGFHFTLNPAAFKNLHSANGSPCMPCATALTEMVGVTRNGDAISPNGSIKPPAVGDPWLVFRARNQLLIGGSPAPPAPQPYPYGGTATGGSLYDSNANKSIKGNTEAAYVLDKKWSKNWSHLFHHQVVRFPLVDYQTWKDVAQSGQKNMYYFRHDTGDAYRKDGVGASLDWLEWFDQNGDLVPTPEAGLYFFDTSDESQPLDGGDADTIADNLTPIHDWDPNVFGEGFIYVNSLRIETSGAGGSDHTVRARMPGEVFLDDGIDLHDELETAGDDCICIRFSFDADEIDGECVLGIRPIGHPDCDRTQEFDGDDCNCSFAILDAMDEDVAQAEAETFRNGIWDVDFNNDGISDALEQHDSTLPGYDTFVADNGGTGGGLVGNGKGFMTTTIPYYPDAQGSGSAARGASSPNGRKYRQGQQTGGGDPDWRRDPRFLNDVAVLGGTVRQPHEPFLNFKYPTTGTYGNATPASGEIKTWTGADTDHGVRVDWRAQGGYNEFSASGTTAIGWTKRTRDATGAVMDIEDVAIDGILFNEGEYGGTGNLRVYGSMIVKGGYTGGGSVDVWFNEDIVKGQFPPARWRLPRVFATARETN